MPSDIRNSVKPYWVNDTLPDGTSIIVRSIHAGDRRAVESIMQQLGPESLYMRFLAPKKHLSERDITYLTEVDGSNHFALIAELLTEGIHFPVGVARFIRDQSSDHDAEVAITVEDEFQKRGIGKRLFHHLSLIAASIGITKFYGLVLVENEPLKGLVRASGYPNRMSFKDDGTMLVEISIGDPSGGKPNLDRVFEGTK